MRRSTWFASLVMMAGLVQAAPVPADAAVAAPVLVPADGASLATSDTVLTATYDVVAGTASRLVVTDTTAGSTVPCVDEVLFSAGMTALRCHVRDLAPGHAFHATATLRDAASTVLRSDSWSFSVDTPVLQTTWPAAGSSVAGTVDDPAPGPGRPLTATYDRALDASATTGLLFSSVAGSRSGVPATTSTSGATVSVEPAADLGAGAYSLVLHAVDASGAASDRTVDVVVGAPVTLPAAPQAAMAFRTTPLPEAVTVAVPTGAYGGLVVYDPVHPDVRRQVDPLPSVPCLYLVGGASCTSARLPLSGLPAGTYAWYAYTRVPGGATASGPDHALTLTGAPPATPTALAAAAPLSPTDPAVVHVTASSDAAAVVVTATSHNAVSVAVEPTGGALDATLPSRALWDGEVTVTAVAFDAYGTASATADVVAPKESVTLDALTSDPRALIGPAGTVDVPFTEAVRAESTLVVRDALGHVTPGTVTPLGVTGLRFAPTNPWVTQTYTVEVDAYAASCTSSDLTTCEQVHRTVAQPVDATPPAPPTSVVVDPRLPLPTTASVTVSGRGAPGDDETVAIAGTDVWTGQLGAADSTGSTPFSTGPVSLSPYPHALLPVKITSYDGIGNATVTNAGYVDRRYPSYLSGSATPLAIPWGTTTTLSGRLTQYGGTALAGRVLTILQRRDNGTTATVGTTTTASDGTFRKVLVLTASGPLQARWSGATSLRPAVTPWTARVAVGARGSTPADHPDSPSGARAEAASPQGVQLSETVRSATDVDWYAFGVATPGHHLIRLGHLPADYAVSLYDRGGNRLGLSARSGRQFEEIYRYLPAGTYYVRVASTRGWSSTVPYHLTFSRVADRVVILSAHHDATLGDVLVELLNNTAQWRYASLTVSCVTSTGTAVRTEHWVGAPLLSPQSRRPFVVQPAACPSGSSLRLAALSETTTARFPAGTWRVTPHSRITTTHYREYPLTLTNTGSTTLRNLSVGVLEYDAEGRVQAFAGMWQDPLAAGASRYVAGISTWRDTPAPNRFAYLAYFV